MTTDDFEPMEQDLQRHRPAQPPIELMDRLRQALPPRSSPEPQIARHRSFRDLFRWILVPATAVLLLGFAGWHWGVHPEKHSSRQTAGSAPLKADDVQIDQQLVKSFDTVARLPGGEPVRFRCREWQDQVTFRDTSGRLLVQQRNPRVEVVPVRFETY